MNDSLLLTSGMLALLCPSRAESASALYSNMSVELYRRGRIRFPYRQAGDGLKVGKTLFGVLSDSRPRGDVHRGAGRLPVDLHLPGL